VAVTVIFAVNPCIAFTAPASGSGLPALSLPNLQNKIVNIPDFYGKPLILAFFASWSKSCADEVLFLDGIYGKYKSKGIKIVGISFDKKTESLENFITKNNVSFDLLIDKKLKSINKYAILIIPTTMLINKEGKIENTFVDFDDNTKKSIIDFVESQGK